VVIGIWDAEEFNGQWSLVLEYVDGLDLTQLVMKSGPLPAARGNSSPTRRACV